MCTGERERRQRQVEYSEEAREDARYSNKGEISKGSSRESGQARRWKGGWMPIE